MQHSIKVGNPKNRTPKDKRPRREVDAMKEAFTEDELNALKSLQAKQKRIQRAQKREDNFFKLADARKSELLIRWGITTTSNIYSGELLDRGSRGIASPLPSESEIQRWGT